jgi:hypothetical protein
LRRSLLARCCRARRRAACPRGRQIATFYRLLSGRP